MSVPWGKEKRKTIYALFHRLGSCHYIPGGEGITSIPLFTSYSCVCQYLRSSFGKVSKSLGVIIYSTPINRALGLSES